MQSLSRFAGGRIPKSAAVGLLLALLLISAIAFVPKSTATKDRSNHSKNPVAATTTKPGRPEFVPGQVLVRFKQGHAFEGRRTLTVPSQRRGAKLQSTATDQITVDIVQFDKSELVSGLRMAKVSSKDTWMAIAALRARDDVLYAEPNYVVHPDDTTPNDPSFGSLYGMTKIAAPAAWDTIRGSTDTPQAFFGSPSIVVGVVDEGIQLVHSDLAANIWDNPVDNTVNGIDEDGNGFIDDLHGYDFINNSGTIPVEGHATHVAGTIGAVGNNGTGVVGVNWRVKLMSLRFIDEVINSGSDADAIRAMGYAKQMRDLWVSSGGTIGANVRVLNNSWGGAPFAQAMSDAISSLGQSNILFVAAAGNSGTNNDVNPHYPSNYQLPNLMSITATDSSDAQVYSYGLHSVLMGAPGVGILSTYPNDTYQLLSGTSMATPHVAGAAALLLAANPALTISKLRSLLAYNGDVLPSLQGKTITGRRLNVFKSLLALNENDTTPPGAVGSFQVTSQTGRTFNLSWVASGDDGATGQASLYEISFVDGFNNSASVLTTLIPSATGVLQTTTVNTPYRHFSGTIKLREFDNVGNEGTPVTIPVSIDPMVADPYVATTATHEALTTGGTPLGLTQDDAYIPSYSLPFSFPFFGQSYSTVRISTNGALYFSTRTDNDSQSSVGGLVPFKMIAGMWDDLDLRTSRRADADVYVTQDATHAVFRWQGVQYGDGTNGDPINFEIELRSDGTIKTRYGGGNTNLFPVVGISNAEPDVYSINSLTSDGFPISLTNAANGLFSLRTNALRIDNMNLAGRVSGGQQIVMHGEFAGLSTVTMGGLAASFIYTNGGGDTTAITVTTPAHAVGAVQIDLTPTTGTPYSKQNAFAYLPTVFTDDTIVVGQTTAKAQHIIELRQSVDALRALAGLGGAPWTDPTLTPGATIRAIHILELRTYFDDAAARLGFSTSAYTDPSLSAGFMIKRIHIEELRQRIRTIAG